MMTPQTVNFVDSPKTQTWKYLKNIVFFFEWKLLYINVSNLTKTSFQTEVTFKPQIPDEFYNKYTIF